MLSLRDAAGDSGAVQSPTGAPWRKDELARTQLVEEPTNARGLTPSRPDRA
jgi:hypothetical protein